MGDIKADADTIGKDWMWDIAPWTVTFDKFWCTFGTIFHFSMLAYSIWRNNKSKKIKNENYLHNLLWYSTLTAIAIFGLNQLSSMTMVFPWFHDAGCMTLSIINTWLYFAGKYGLWFYSIVRLHDVFSKSGTLAYKEWFLRGLVVIFALECIIINVLHAIFDDSVNYKGICCSITAEFVVPLFALVDVTSNLGCLWLFYRKMRRLWNMVNSIQSETINEQTVELAYVIRKYTVLTAFSAFSTILLGASVAITPIFWSFLTWDSMINTSCLLLFDKRYDYIYRVLCICCTKRVKFDALIKMIKHNREIAESTAKDEYKLHVDDPKEKGDDSGNNKHLQLNSLSVTPTTTAKSNSSGDTMKTSFAVNQGNSTPRTITSATSGAGGVHSIQLSTISDAPQSNIVTTRSVVSDVDERDVSVNMSSVEKSLKSKTDSNENDEKSINYTKTMSEQSDR